MSQTERVLTLVDPSRPGQWEAVLELTTEMVGAARAGRWPRVTELARERRQRIEAFFQGPVPAHEAGWVAAGIRRLLAMDRELLELVEAGRAASSAAVIELRRGRAARSAYRSCAASPAG